MVSQFHTKEYHNSHFYCVVFKIMDRLGGRRVKRKWQYFFSITAFIILVGAKIGQSIAVEEVHIVRHIDTKDKVVALTFDDGPNVKTTPKVLEVLKEKNVKATFFILGENAVEHPELVKQAASEGHEIASHSYTHRHLSKMGPKDCADELAKAESIISQCASKPRYFRPPGGLFNDNVLEEAKRHGYTTILWSVDPHDWQSPSVSEMIKRVEDNVKPGGIVLMHDGQPNLPTPKALGTIIDDLRAQGYSFVTIDELLRHEEVKTTGFFNG